GCSRSERAGTRHIPCRKSAALQNAEAILLLGRAAEIRLRQGPEAAGPRRAGGAGAAGRTLQAEKLTMRRIVQPGPPAPERVQWVEARGRAFPFTLEAGLPLPAAARPGCGAGRFGGGTPTIGA